MKKQALLLLLFSAVWLFAAAQSIPRGINYQAVARDRSGQIVSGKIITLKISMESMQDAVSVVHFSEIHRITTDSTGYFNVVIGKGSTLAGNFNQIPWSSRNILMELALKPDGENQFTVVSTTELMAVPYAYHAGTADRLSGNYTPYVQPGTSTSSGAGNTINVTGPVPATSWQLIGNTGTNPPLEYIGTGDNKDLYIKTNAQERMKILASNGNITLTGDLTIAYDLTVERNTTVSRNLLVKNDELIDSSLTIKKKVLLNTASGSTSNYGPFTVERISPTLLTGTLQVDQVTNLNDSLKVNNLKPTLLTGTLRVNQATNLYDSLRVNNSSPTALTGTLRVDSDVTMNNHVILDNPNINSIDSVTGAMVVAGGVGIMKNLNLGGDAKISGKTSFKGQTRITDATPSLQPDSGALVVSGGVGIGKQLAVGGYAHFYDTLQVDGSGKLEKSMLVSDSVSLTNGLTATGQVTLNGKTTSNGQLTITADNLASAGQANYSSYPLQVEGGQQGIAIKVSGGVSASKNYVSFFDDNGMQGRIEGVATGEFANTSEYAQKYSILKDEASAAELVLAQAVFMETAAGIDLIAAGVASTICAGVGICVVAPPPARIYTSLVKFALCSTFLVAASIGINSAYTNKSDWENRGASQVGVTYASGAGDYAEYIEMVDKHEKMFPGDIVGLKGGKITRKTDDADKIMVLSRHPVVLGNLPKQENYDGIKKVAFLGQVPVKVVGKVNVGDYILPDGNYSGMGIAVHPESIRSEELKKIAGVAWTASEEGKLVSTINVAVGLNVIDNQREVQSLTKELNDLKNKMSASEKELARLIPGYAENTAGSEIVSTNDRNTDVALATSKEITYYMPERAEFEKAIEDAIPQLVTEIKSPEGKEYLHRLKTDGAFRTDAVDQIMNKVKTLIERQKQLDIEADNK